MGYWSLLNYTGLFGCARNLADLVDIAVEELVCMEHPMAIKEHDLVHGRAIGNRQ